MARDGEVLNSGLLQRMADFLDIGGVRRYPKHINTDMVQPVYDLSRNANALPPAAPEFLTREAHSGNFPAGSTQSAGVNLIGSAATSSLVTVPTAGVIPVDNGKETRVMSISCGVGYAAAGAAADAAANVRLSIMIVLRNLNGGGLVFPIIEEFAVVENVAPYSYSWTFPQGSRFATAAGASYQQRGSNSRWDGYIPPGWSAWVELVRTPGTGFFPNLTSMDTYFSVSQRLNRGDWKA